MKKIYIDNLDKNLDKFKLINDLVRDNNKLDVEFHYKSSFGTSKYLRDFIDIIGNIFEIYPVLKTRLITIIDELNNNAVEYGTSTGGTNIVRIKIRKGKTTSTINLEVEDDGKGACPKTALEMETLRAHQLKKGYGEHDSIRGRGLFLITVQIVDRLYFKNSKNGGLIVGIIKKF